MKNLSNIVKFIICFIIISLIVLGIVMIVKNITSLSNEFGNKDQVVISGGAKQVRQVFTSLDSIIF